jgi:hypothetical protein
MWGDAMRNYLNTNDIFPILEIIRREIKKNDFDRDRIFLGNEQEAAGNPDDVLSIEVLRGGNPVDPEIIDAVIVTYVDGTVETITLIRGANPPVPDTVPDHWYINKVMVSGFTVQVTSPYGSRTISGQLVRENGYGKVQRLDLTYSS